MRVETRFAACPAGSLALQAAPTPSATFRSLARIVVEGNLRFSLETATQMGDHRFDDRLLDLSAPGIERQVTCARHYAGLLRGIPLAQLSPDQGQTLVRAVFSSGVFAEGWAVYAEQVMVRAGYGGPEVHLQQLKMRLRVTLNAILDQGIQGGNMTEAQAMALMMDQGFQEEGEAAGKWKRACLSSTQLSTYFVGATEMDDLRAATEAKAKRSGQAFDLKAYHDALLSHGTVAPKYLRSLLGL